MDIEQRIEEFRASGWSDGEIRDYRRGYEGVTTGSQVSIPVDLGAPAHRPFTAPRVLVKGDRGTWLRNTPAGQLRSVVEPDDPSEEAEERAAAQQFIDNHEYVYGRRPSMAEARLAVGRRSDGVVLDGAEEIRAAFSQAGIAVAFVDQVKPLPHGGAAVTSQPTRRG